MASSEMSYETIRIAKRGLADWLSLDRPSALNAMNARMIAELADYFAARVTDDDTRVIVLRGTGRAFCAGLDLTEMNALIRNFDTNARLRFQQRLSGLILAMRRCPQPIVCLVHGSASGGGFALALASDIRFCTPDARMNAAFINVGLSGCDVGMSYLLPRLVGASVATELLMTGAFLQAPRALSLGLVSDVVEHDALEAVAEKMVNQLLRADPLSLAITKQGMQLGMSASSLEAAVAIEDRQQALLAGADSFRQRIQAFAAKLKR